jgi:hypothetical protein
VTSPASAAVAADLPGYAPVPRSALGPALNDQGYYVGRVERVKAHLDAVTERAAAPVIAKYTGVLAAADITEFAYTTTFQIMQSLRLDTGPSGPVHP